MKRQASTITLRELSNLAKDLLDGELKFRLDYERS